MLEEQTMGKISTQDEAFECIRKWRDNDRLAWPEIAERLRKAGYVGVISRKPLTANSVRALYYQDGKFNWTPKDKAPPVALQALEREKMIKNILNLEKHTDTQKIIAIRAIIDSAG
jgi:hypothetical protein